jgi:hypothetical protein
MFAFFKKLFGKADLNSDGKVNAQDAKVAVAAVEAAAKGAKSMAKTQVKKTVTKAKKAAADKKAK